MGRTIPSISHRLDERLRQWDRFGRQLHGKERKAFQDLLAAVRNRRSAVDAADEADLGVAILLAAITYMKGQMDERAGEDGLSVP